LIRNLTNAFLSTYEERLIKSYGFCSGEGFGYIQYLKKNYENVQNIKIINYSSIEPAQWMVFKPILSKNGENKIKENLKDQLILINYPGKYIKNLAINQNNVFIVNKNIRNTNAITEIEFSLFNQNLKLLNVEIEIKNIYHNNNINNKVFHIDNVKEKLVKEKLVKEKLVKKKIYYPFDSLIHDKVYINFKDENNNIVNNQIKNLFITFQNKTLLENFKVIDNYNNCFYLKK
jgi:hypothetical protein